MNKRIGVLSFAHSLLNCEDKGYLISPASSRYENWVLGFAHSLELRRQRLFDFGRLLEVVLHASSWLLTFRLLFAHTSEALEPVDIGLMKFLGLCLSALSWYLEFASAFSTSSAPFTTNDLPL
ncbi:hypothetical protein BHM03_00022320 [Ensete ventricosum]|nr:hypothetical protein BHM03_00022320 [Ensete ventricosum]